MWQSGHQECIWCEKVIGNCTCYNSPVLKPPTEMPFKAFEFEPIIGSPSSEVTVENMPPEYLQAILTKYMGDAVFAKRFTDCITMLRQKNADYSQGEQKGDRIAAFRRIARDINITMAQAWAVFCQKHWGAVMKFVKDGIVESEPLDGRINDIINYMVLLGAIVDDMKKADSK